MKNELTQEEKRVKIAVACGFRWHKNSWNEWWLVPPDRIKEYKPEYIFEDGIWKHGNILGGWSALPDYFNDLNACHEMEKQAPMGYGDAVRSIVARDAGVMAAHICDQYVICATATQRAEAFGLILNLWK